MGLVMDREELLAEAERDLERARAERRRIVLARDANPYLDHHQVPEVLATLDRWIARMERTVAEEQGR